LPLTSDDMLGFNLWFWLTLDGYEM